MYGKINQASLLLLVLVCLVIQTRRNDLRNASGKAIGKRLPTNFFFR